MAHKLKAINTYRPRVKLQQRMDSQQLEQRIITRTTFNEGFVHAVLMEFKNALLDCFYQGRSIKLDGVGTFFPEAGMKGDLFVSFRADSDLIRRLNDSGMFKGKIKNKNMVDKSTEEFIQRWNEEHPDDPVE